MKDQCFNTNYFTLLSSGQLYTWNNFAQHHKHFPIDDFTVKVNKIKQLLVQAADPPPSLLLTNNKQPSVLTVPSEVSAVGSDIAAASSPLSLSKQPMEKETNEPTSSKQNDNNLEHDVEDDDEGSGASSTNLKGSIDDKSISEEEVDSNQQEEKEEVTDQNEEEEEDTNKEIGMNKVDEIGSGGWVYSRDVSHVSSSIPQVFVDEQDMMKVYKQSHSFVISIISYFNQSYKLDESMESMSQRFMVALNNIHEDIALYFYANIVSILNAIGKPFSTLLLFKNIF